VPRTFPPMPEIGRPEAYYAKHVHRADKLNDLHSHEAFKVGQYITLGLNPYLSWPEKLKYFRHALNRHCNPPPYPDDDGVDVLPEPGRFRAASLRRRSIAAGERGR